MKNRLTFILLLTTIIFLVPLQGNSTYLRSQIRIVGSSTVFPFTSLAAEIYALKNNNASVIVEVNGTGGGIDQFCSGIGTKFPDLVNASRPMKDSERQKCLTNGVKDITELKIGFDGIIVANSIISPQLQALSTDLWYAFAKFIPKNGDLVPNPYKRWNEINPNLPNSEIKIFGPPPTSGTRDAFIEKIMLTSCPIKRNQNLKTDNEVKFYCGLFREDGHYIDAGENDNLIIHKLELNPEAFGIISFNYLNLNTGKVQGTLINAHAPTLESIVSGTYPATRSLFLYVKDQHLSLIPNVAAFLKELFSDDAMGENGYLLKKGLIPLPKDALMHQQKIVKNLGKGANEAQL